MVMNSFGICISSRQWEGSACIQSALFFFLLSFGLGGEGFFCFIFPLFPTCPLQVPNMFPMCFPRVFPIAPGFNPRCFAQSPPLLTCIDGPKGEAIYHSIESFYFGEPPIVSTFFCNGPIKLTHCPPPKKKSWTCEAPPTIINMKQK